MNALNVQAEESREIARALGWQISMQYIESESGTGSHRRGQYEQLLEDMEADKFDIVMIKSIDRLMRSAREWYLFLDKLTRCKKQLYIYIDHKFYTPEDNLITGIKAIRSTNLKTILSTRIKKKQIILITITIKRKLVPHLLWNLELFIMFLTFKGFPLSIQLMHLCSAP